MQFTRGLIALTTLITMAAATGTPPPAIPASQCNTGPIQCCTQTGFADTPSIATALGLVGVVVDDLNVFLGATCSPITVIGLPGNSCDAQPVCCTNNNFNGVVAIGCTPVNINL